MNNKITFKNVEDGLSYFLFEGNLLCVLTFRKSSRPFPTPHVGATVTLPCFQEIQTLQGKKTDVGELEKEREEAVQRLQVGSCRPPRLLSTSPIQSLPWQPSGGKDKIFQVGGHGVSGVCNSSLCFHGY